MKCLYCNAPLERYDYCDNCGHDISFQKKIERISNSYYNSGLDKAQVRDLSGAKEDLRIALLYDKENVEARNLLGLVEYETGEVVAALAEWVVSTNLSKENNLAKEYIDKLQANPNQLNEINLTIQKYNQGLEYCVTGQEDMAEIQLKKVLVSNPKYIRAYQLLCLLMMKKGEYDKARRLARKALRIDRCDSTLLRYLHEIDIVTGTKTDLDSKNGFSLFGKEEKEDTIPRHEASHYREYTGLTAFLNIVLGLFVGAAVIGLLVVPQVRQSTTQKYQEEVQSSKEALALATQEIESLKKSVELQANQAVQGEAAIASATTKTYENLLLAQKMYQNGEADESVLALLEGVEVDSLSEEAKSIYQSITGGIKAKSYQGYYDAGISAYVAGNYDEAIKQLTLAVEANPGEYDALSYLAHSYYNKGDYQTSNEVFTLLQERFPARASEVSGYIRDLGQ